MTIHTYQGAGWVRDFTQVDDPVVEAIPFNLTIIVPDSTTGFTYSIDGPPSPGDLPTVTLTTGATTIALNDVSIDAFEALGHTVDAAIGQVTWGPSNNVTQVLVIEIDYGTERDFAIFQLGGVALPSLTTLAEVQAFENSITGVEGIPPGGPLSEGATIGYTALPNSTSQTDNPINGTSGNDSLDGTSGNDLINPGTNPLEDTINGSTGDDVIVFTESQGSAFYTVNYSGLTGPITANVDQPSGIANVDKGADGTDRLIDFFTPSTGFGIRLVGTSSADTFNIVSESGSWMSLAGTGGNDTFNIDGTPDDFGIVRLKYSAAAGPINVNLATGVILDGDGGTDQVNVAAGISTRIEIQATSFSDTLVGSDRSERFILGPGNDTLNAGGGDDLVRYDRSGVGAVNVNLQNQTATGTWHGNAFTHSISNIEGIRGSRNDNDLLTGDSNDNSLHGVGGNDTLNGANGDDWLEGGAGDDSIDGGNGFDTAWFSLSQASASITLGAAGEATVTSALGTDVVQRVERLQFSDGQVDLGSAPVVATPTPTSTVHIFDAIVVARDLSQNTDVVTDVQNFESRVALPTTQTTFSYSVIGPTDGGLYEIDLNANDLFTALNAITLASLEASGDTITNLIGNVSWDNGTKTAQVLVTRILDESGDNEVEVIIQLGGDTLPPLNSPADFDAFNAGISGITQITSGPFAPNTPIQFTSVAGLTQTQTPVNPVDGTDGDDTLTGTAGDDLITPYDNASEDVMIGTAGDDIYVLSHISPSGFYSFNYSNLNAPIDLTFNQDWAVFEVDKGVNGTDILLDLNALPSQGTWVSGTSGDDTFNIALETGTWTGLDGLQGNDTFNIGGTASMEGVVRLNYAHAANGISANLGTGVISDGRGGTDQLNYDPASGMVIELHGSAHADTITGSSRNERFILRQGNDTLDAGDGRDILRYDRSGVGAVSVSLLAGVATGTWDGDAFTHDISGIEDLRGSRTGADTLIGDNGRNTIFGRGGNDTLQGEGENDWLVGEDGDDSLLGGSGNDTLLGGAGDDILDGGSGTGDEAQIHVNRAGATLVRAGNQVTVTSAEGTDILSDIEFIWFTDDYVDVSTLLDTSTSFTPTSGDDSLTGTSGNDTIDGLAGNDTILGEDGNDSLIGGEGDDVFINNIGEDTLIGGPGNDSLIVDVSQVLNGTYTVRVDLLNGQLFAFEFPTIGADSLDSIENFRLIGEVDVDVLGNTDANEIITGQGNDTLNGWSGDDTLNGGGGDDLLIGGHGSDVIIVDSTGDRVAESRKWTGHDTVMSSVDFRMGSKHIEDLELTGTARIGAGNGLMNTITGNDADNILDGGRNVDTMIGGLGDDTYLIRAPGDTAIEQFNEGIDAVRAYRSYALEAHVEKLFMQNVFTRDGDPTNLNGIGNGLGNTIVGTPYANTIVGREGNDVLKGQAGDDTFVFDRDIGPNNVDRIIDFEVNGDDDTLKFKATALGGGVGAGVLSADDFATGTAAADASDRFIFDQASGQLWYDADGSGVGAQVLVSTFEQNAVVDADDILIF